MCGERGASVAVASAPFFFVPSPAMCDEDCVAENLLRRFCPGVGRERVVLGEAGYEAGLRRICCAQICEIECGLCKSYALSVVVKAIAVLSGACRERLPPIAAKQGFIDWPTVGDAASAFTSSGHSVLIGCGS
jgi:hypothetical protein